MKVYYIDLLIIIYTINNNIFIIFITQYYFLLGLLLLIFGFNNSHLLSLCLGALVIILSTCGMPGAIFGCRWWRRRRRQRRSSVVIAGTPPIGSKSKSSLVRHEHDISVITVVQQNLV